MKLSAAVVLICVLFALSGLFIDDIPMDLGNLFAPFSLKHPLGTNFLGKDVLKELAKASLNSLSVGCFGALLACIIGLIVAIFMQFYFKNIIQKFLDLLIATPSLILIMFIQSLYDGGKITIIILFGLTHFAVISRTLNVFFTTLSKQDFLFDLMIFKADKLDILKEFSSLLIGILFVLFVQNVAHIIMSESTLSFFGLGLKPFEASIGNMLNDNTKSIYLGYYHLIICPGIYLFALIFSLSNLSNAFKKRARL